jgi:putative DNA primase/helicase
MQGNGHARVSLHEKIADLAHWDEIECELAVRGVAREYDISVRELRKAIARQRTRNDRRARSNGGDAAPDPNKILEEAAKPELVVETARLPAAAAAVRDLFAGAGVYYEWGTPAKVVSASDGSLPQIVPLSVDGVVNEVDALCRPIKLTPDGKRIECTLPDRVARQYLAKKHEWQLPRLAGTTTAPLLGEDGGIRAAEGFDRETRLFCANVPVLEVPARPTERQVGAALCTLRAAFQTFPFADSERVWDGKLKLELVDLDKAPGLDESSFLVSLITAVCRPCLYLAPGLMVVAPQRSGSGSGKGLLARAICLIAFGLRLAGFTPGKDKGELEKRINGELLEGGPALFVDNVNDAVLASPTLEGAMTERPFKVRPFGTLKMPMLDSGPFIVVTGNGLTPERRPGASLRNVRSPRREDGKPVAAPLPTARPGFPRRHRTPALGAAECGADDLAVRPAERGAARRRTAAGQLFGLGAMVPRPALYAWLPGSRRAVRRIGRRRPAAPG